MEPDDSRYCNGCDRVNAIAPMFGRFVEAYCRKYKNKELVVHASGTNCLRCDECMQEEKEARKKWESVN